MKNNKSTNVKTLRVGELLIQEDIINEDKLNNALKVQKELKAENIYQPIGEVCVKLNYLSRATLNTVLKKYRKNILLGDLLFNFGLLSREQLEEAIEKQKHEKKKLGEILVRDGYISESNLLNVVSIQLGISKVFPNPKIIEPELLSLLRSDFCKENTVLPVYKKDDVLTIVMANPLDENLIATIENITKLYVEPAISSPREIINAINFIYNKKDLGESQQIDCRMVIDHSDLTLEQGNNSVEAVNFIITQAVLEKASDIHIEPMEDRLRVRYRIDGVMQHKTDFPSFLAPMILSRIKVLSNLDVAEKKKHQDGRLQTKFLGKNLDLRVSTYAAMYGENIVIRILEQSNSATLDINQLGFNPYHLRMFTLQLNQPTGVILVTGPTGSGKTTTLYSSLNYLNDIGRVIITVEDPIEISIEGIIQAQINPKMDLSYADFIKSMMRQDPDILMVGEIRDKTAAEAVVQCALTGHKVLSTFHTDDTTGALLRLMDMGINTFLISSTIVSVCSQRLVRTLCNNCKTHMAKDDNLLKSFSVISDNLNFNDYTIYSARGCPLCNYTGYKGRTGIHELLVVNEKVRDAILARQTSSKIRLISRQTSNLISMQEDGFYKVLEGVTTFEEILRVAPKNDSDMETKVSLKDLLLKCESKI